MSPENLPDVAFGTLPKKKFLLVASTYITFVPTPAFIICACPLLFNCIEPDCIVKPPAFPVIVKPFAAPDIDCAPLTDNEPVID